MKKRAVCGLVLAAALGLSGCGSTLSQDVDKLLRAPQLSGETSAVQKALNSYLGESAQLKYPASGDSLSPFLFGDWNGDGAEDAAVLYTCAAKGQNICLAILEMQEGAWVVTQEVEGLSTEVETVSFAAMDDSNASQIVVGYGSTQGDRYLAVYSYQQRTLQTVLQQNYSRMLLADITGDGSDDLTVVYPEDEQGTIQMALLTNAGGSFALTQQLTVGQGVYTGCAALCAGTGTDGRPYLVVDGKVGGYLASTILIYDAKLQQLQVYTPPGGVDMVSVTMRYNRALLSCDIDGNGTVDIPTEATDGGQISLGIDHRLSFVLWRDYTGGNAGTTHFGVMDEEYDFYLPLPDSWRGAISLDVNKNGDGWRVLQGGYDGAELLEVRVTDLDAVLPQGFARIGTIGSQVVRAKLNTEAKVLNMQMLEDGILIL